MHPEITGAPEFLHFSDILKMRRAMSGNALGDGKG
jgi:hypothetical protein